MIEENGPKATEGGFEPRCKLYTFYIYAAQSVGQKGCQSQNRLCIFISFCRSKIMKRKHSIQYEDSFCCSSILGASTASTLVLLDLFSVVFTKQQIAVRRKKYGFESQYSQSFSKLLRFYHQHLQWKSSVWEHWKSLNFLFLNFEGFFWAKTFRTWNFG